MPPVLVSDTSVLIDLDRGGLITVLFQPPFEIAVPDLLFSQELDPWRGCDLRALGLQVLGLDDDGVLLAQAYLVREVRLSVPDAFALALARIGGHVLLTGDRNLRALADKEAVPCHGLLWLLDQFKTAGLVGPRVLLDALGLIAGHSRCRLPIEDVHIRQERYRRRLREDRGKGTSGHDEP